MERISIFNYEAFYLDYLEGNLSAEDTALLFAFLEANPDLKLDDEDLPVFNAEKITMDAGVKNDLKQPLMDEPITDENAEYFLIAQTEGLLDQQKSAELDAFVADNAQWSEDKVYYSAVHAEPDLTVVYADKDGIKRKVVVLWQYVSIAAAASVIAFFLIWSSMNRDIVPTTGNFVAEQGAAKNGMGTNQTLASQNEDLPLENTSENGLTASTDNPRPQNVGMADRPEYLPVDNINRRPVGPILTALNDRELEPIAKRTFDNNVTAEENTNTQDVASAFANMENPIEPITKFVAEKTNREVDFRTNGRKEGKGKGFFLKIGKFELSRKKH